jgi:hypothetical protein
LLVHQFRLDAPKRGRHRFGLSSVGHGSGRDT